MWAKTWELPFLGVARFWMHNALKTCISGIFQTASSKRGFLTINFFYLIPYAQDDDDDHDNLDDDDDDDEDDADNLHDDDDEDDKDHDKDMRSIY